MLYSINNSIKGRGTMSLQIGLQKSNKDSLYKDRLVVRRHEYDPDSKKTKSGKVIFSCKKVGAPKELPEEKLETFQVTNEEHQQYKDFINKLREEEHDKEIGLTKNLLKSYLDDGIKRFAERSDGVTLEELEELDGLLVEFRKQVTRHKKLAKKRMKQPTEKQLELTEKQQ